MKCPICKAKIDELDEICPRCKTNFDDYERENKKMEKNKNILKNWKLWSGIIIGVMIIIFIINYNSLSEYETTEKFIDLVSQSEYGKAKKYITSNFEWDLAAVKKKNFNIKESFSYSYGDYKLNDYDEIAYIDINDKQLKFMSIYKFKLKKTIFGYKIDGYSMEYVNY